MSDSRTVEGCGEGSTGVFAAARLEGVAPENWCVPAASKPLRPSLPPPGGGGLGAVLRPSNQLKFYQKSAQKSTPQMGNLPLLSASYIK